MYSNARGFTLIEITITIAILVALLTASLSIYRSVSYNNKRELAFSIRDSIIAQIDRYYKAHGHPPIDVNEFKQFLMDKSYFPRVPVNPFYPEPPEDGWIYFYDASSGLVVLYPRIQH
ncbi:MAG: type II secretion system protein [Thermoproteota archaeon]